VKLRADKIRLSVRRFVIWLVEITKHFASGLYNRVGDHHVLLLAGGLSFSLIVCILPMVLIIFAIIGRFLEQPAIGIEISNFIDKVLPYPEQASKVKDLILSRIEEFKIYKSVAGIVGLGGLIFASSGLFSSMRTILNQVYNVQTSQSIYVSKLRDIALVLLVIFYFLLSTTLLPTLVILEDFADRIGLLSGLALPGFQDLLVEIATVVVIFFAFYILYALVPQQRIPQKAVFVSAVAAAILWKIAERFFGYYITEVATYKRIYGAYSLLIVTAFWIYYTSAVFIISAEIGQLYREWKAKRSAGVPI